MGWRAIGGRALRSRINGVLFDRMGLMLTDLLWRGYPLVELGRFEGGLSVSVCEDHGRNGDCRRCEWEVEQWMSATLQLE